MISPRSAIQIDISKAFDSVQWPFLINTLSALNFPPRFIRWIELCVTTASFSVQVNGELTGQNQRGLCQGCSLSPNLFVICMHVVSTLLDKDALERRVGYHPRCQNIQLTHLCFADDILVFTDGTKLSIEGILQIFDRFAEFSALKISLEKSTLYMVGVRETERENILRSFPFASGSLPVRYFGLPLLTKQMTARDYSPLIEQIRNKISSWTARHFSFAGRLQLISSVIQGLTNFWMSAFRLPSACLKEIDSLCCAFLWSGLELNTKKAKVSWSEVCLPNEEGGLGLRSLKEANKHDNWSPLGPLLAITGHRGCIDMGISTDATLAQVLLTHRRRHHHVDHLNEMEACIKAIRTKGLVDTADVVLWKGSGDRFTTTFSTKDVWKAIRRQYTLQDWYRGLWFHHSTPKFAFVTWLAIKNRLSTGDRMLGWNTGAPTSCVFCQDPMETRNHLFFTCPYSWEVWSALSSKILECHFSTDWPILLNLLTDTSLDKVRLFLLRYTFQLLVHSIWRERNNMRHGETAIPPTQLIKRLDKDVRNRIASIADGGYDKCMEVWFATH
ncbi:PREDICTED: uncharacterized protein LOC104704326 [Camelina sativa]|uniref:Uncharacterized protein LOC104704326 n=1 Tax=Camelina sativa TaxID=90675 RepID=A0ABM0T073_CAMSA|nr:PREDICTED: uncharacterized protein LOC104704326 [Camelina sativa]